MQTIKEKLKQLRLSSIAESLESRNAYALENKVSYLDFLELLLEDEQASRHAAAYKRKMIAFRLSEQKTIQEYDFSYQPELDKRLLTDLSACRFSSEYKNVILMGNPGVGKTHLANGLGIAALQKGYKVHFTHAKTLIEKLYASKADGSYHTLLTKVFSTHLLIIDELGFKKLPASGLDDFFEIIRARYEKASVVITSNRNFEDWGTILGDAVMASAIIDRLVHHAVVIKITGKSYRIKNYTYKSIPVNS